MRYPESTSYDSFLAGLLRDYDPQTAQERLMVHEVAATWQRLQLCRDRERLFFSLQRAKHCALDGQPPGAYEKEGAEVVMWINKPQRAYDQILRAIRDAEMAFDRAVKRVEFLADRRLRRALLIEKHRPAATRLRRPPQPKVRAAGDPLPAVVEIAKARSRTWTSRDPTPTLKKCP